MPTETFEVPELGCDGCAEIVEGAVAEVPDVSGVEADPEAGTVTVEGDGFDPDAVIEKVERAGYDVGAPSRAA